MKSFEGDFVHENKKDKNTYNNCPKVYSYPRQSDCILRYEEPKKTIPYINTNYFMILCTISFQFTTKFEKISLNHLQVALF